MATDHAGVLLGTAARCGPPTDPPHHVPGVRGHAVIDTSNRKQGPANARLLAEWLAAAGIAAPPWPPPAA